MQAERSAFVRGSIDPRPPRSPLFVGSQWFHRAYRTTNREIGQTYACSMTQIPTSAASAML